MSKEKKYSLMPAAQKADILQRCLTEHKAKGIRAFRLPEGNPLAEVVLIATASSARHARSLSDALSEACRQENLENLRTEGYQEGQWILVDLNDVIVHVFQQESRELYRLEDLWKEAELLPPPAATDGQAPSSGNDSAISSSLKAEGTDASEDKQNSAFDKTSAIPSSSPKNSLPKKPLLLLILDGYGLAPAGPSNAASLAETPTLDRLLNMQGMGRLEASGRAVGLPTGFIGNSEVGHLNIGSGRIVYQDMTRIDVAAEDGSLFTNPVLLELCDKIKKQGGRLHFCGLLSDGGVHSHIRHLEALLKLAQKEGIPALVHAFMDGRDTPPASGRDFVLQLEPVLAETGARLADIMGRFYAMDRDKRWERVEIAWNALLHGEGERANSASEALAKAYAVGETDEFLKPRILLDPSESALRDGDGVFCFNFRADRGRELVHALTDAEFDGFSRGELPKLSGVATMTSYDASLQVPVAFKKEVLSHTAGEIVADLGLKQLRIAETEKYAHVTYFFSGGRETPFEGEDRILVASPKDVPTYDLKPEMSAREVTDKLLEAWDSDKYAFTVCNLANPDMVGHTGIIPAAVKACETVDACVARIEKAVREKGGILCITADHGNVEKMLDDQGRPQTAHTLNRTPFLILDEGKAVPVNDGKLGDIMPTLFAFWGIPAPQDMTGKCLLKG